AVRSGGGRFLGACFWATRLLNSRAGHLAPQPVSPRFSGGNPHALTRDLPHRPWGAAAVAPSPVAARASPPGTRPWAATKGDRGSAGPRPGAARERPQSDPCELFHWK